MEVPFLEIHVRIIGQAHEDTDMLCATLNAFFDLPSLKIPINKDSFESETKLTRAILTFDIKKRANVRQICERLFSRITKNDVQTIINQLESRIDEDCVFYLRFTKPVWLANSTLQLTDSSDCLHIRFAIAAFPKKRPIAYALVEKYLKANMQNEEYENKTIIG